MDLSPQHGDLIITVLRKHKSNFEPRKHLKGSLFCVSLKERSKSRKEIHPEFFVIYPFQVNEK